MATLDIQGIKVNCETTSYLTDYKISMHFIRPETNDDMLESMEFTVRSESAQKRSDLTFSKVEELLNEKIEDIDLEITEISSIRVKEVKTFKKSEYQDGENYK
jgi:ribosomal protein S12 methylthiotransferase accessory factor YcaO